jgi:carbon monoxide dehydrogenase subunit G
MKITGSERIPFPVETVWDALLDPAVLVRTIPGCERLETLGTSEGDHRYAMTVTAGVASIKGTYDGTCALSDLQEHESLVMRLTGAGAPGTIDATVQVSFGYDGEQTTVDYDADAVVGGMVGGVGQRMLGSVSKRMAGEFFGNVGDAIAGAGVRAGDGSPPDRSLEQPAAAGGEVGQVFTAPPRPAPSQQDFLKGIAVGAGLVLLGVVAGSLFGRRGR